FRTHPHRLPTHFVLGFAGQFPGINLFHAQYSTTNRYLIAGLIRLNNLTPRVSFALGGFDGNHQ
ncbi:hypothetical protein, partial [Azonexus fungiphilus]|uniref:hypothetical protein n=1 Tax=Azonexus fungiphilus TaxID=146940 RepID=UPI001C2CBA79